MTGSNLDVHYLNRRVYPGVAWDVPKEAWLTAEGYGFLAILYNFGPQPSDGVDTVFKLACPNGCQLTTWVGDDYVQDTLTCRVNGPTPETVEALAKHAARRLIEPVA